MLDYPRSLIGLRVHFDVKAKDVASWIGVSLSRYYYLERNPLDLTIGRVVTLSTGFQVPPSIVFQAILEDQDIL